VKELGRRMAEVNKEPRSTTFLRQRLFDAVQRGNAACMYFRNIASSGRRFLLAVFIVIVIVIIIFRNCCGSIGLDELFNK